MEKENSLNSIAHHVSILNEEVGGIKIDMSKVKNDIKWLKKIIGYISIIITGVFVTIAGCAIKFIFLS